jgi:hypothetical protein
VEVEPLRSIAQGFAPAFSNVVRDVFGQGFEMASQLDIVDAMCERAREWSQDSPASVSTNSVACRRGALISISFGDVSTGGFHRFITILLRDGGTRSRPPSAVDPGAQVIEIIVEST